jgi:hypothetical protein
VAELVAHRTITFGTEMRKAAVFDFFSGTRAVNSVGELLKMLVEPDSRLSD